MVYLGVHRSLRALVPGDHPAFAVHGSALRRGRLFLEATDRGPRLIDLDELLGAQDFAIVRYAGVDEDRSQGLVRALDVLLSRAFVSPPSLSIEDHSAHLLSAVLGVRLGVEATAGRGFPSWRRIGERTLDADAGVDIVLSSLDGAPLPEERAQEAVRALLERERSGQKTR